MHKQGFYGEKIVWITYNPRLTLDRRLRYDCNQTVVDIVSEGMLTLDIQFLRSDQDKTISGLVRFVALALFICLFAHQLVVYLLFTYLCIC